jgi:hypothetical protein
MKYSITVFDENEVAQDLPGYHTLVEAIATIKVLNRSCILNEVRVWVEIKAATMTTIAERIEKHAFQPTCHLFDESGEYLHSYDDSNSLDFIVAKVAILSSAVEELVA